jgi:hypothetical protein
MAAYELTNDQRKYFGLNTVANNWKKQALNDTVIIYFNKNKIVKVLNYQWGYVEYDTDINTKEKLLLLPKTSKGKEQKLTVAKLLKEKGSGIRFSGSFEGGGIQIYDNRRNVVFIKSYPGESPIQSFGDIDDWIATYISNLPSDYFDWLKAEISKNKQKIQVIQGTIIAFKISQKEYGFARVLSENYGLFKSLIVAPYAFIANSLQVDINYLLDKKMLPAIYVSDIEIYRGSLPIVGYKPLSNEEKQIVLPQGSSISITIPYTKSDIVRSMNDDS